MREKEERALRDIQSSLIAALSIVEVFFKIGEHPGLEQELQKRVADPIAKWATYIALKENSQNEEKQ